MILESIFRFGFYIITTAAFLSRDFSSIYLHYHHHHHQDKPSFLQAKVLSTIGYLFLSNTRRLFTDALNLIPSSSGRYYSTFRSRDLYMTLLDEEFNSQDHDVDADDESDDVNTKMWTYQVNKRKNPFVNGNHLLQNQNNQLHTNNGDGFKYSSVTGDIQYLRKRTEHILRITTRGPLTNHTGSILNYNQQNDNTMSSPATSSTTTNNLVFMSTVPLIISSKGMKADRKTFNWLIDAWSTSGEVDAPEKAMALLQRMEELTWPQLYNASLTAASSSCPSSSSCIISSVPSLNKDDLLLSNLTTTVTATATTPPLSSTSFQPNVQSYTKVMSAYARSGRLDAGILAEELLNRMLSAQLDPLSSSSSSSYPYRPPFPTAQTFTHVMEAYANSGSIDAAPKVQQLCNQIEQMYLSFLKQKEGKETNHLQEPKLYYPKEKQQPQYYLDKTHTTFLSLHQQSIHPSKWEGTQHSLRPTARLYNALINAWAKSDLDGAAQMAEQCLDRMEEMQTLVGGEDLIPNTFHYNSVIHAWANRGGIDILTFSPTLIEIDPDEDNVVDDNTAMDIDNNKINLIPAERAESILERMEASFRLGNLDARPNTISYNACIDAWAKSGHERAGQRAEALLRRMEKLYESKINLSVKPNTRSYNSVMNAYSKSKDPNSARNAERIFDEMECLYKAGNVDVKPDFISFATIISAWAKSYSYGKADRVLNIYRHMNDLYTRGDLSVRPNVVIFNTVINACAYTMGDITEQRRAIEIAQMMLSELEKSSYGKPDQVTFGTFLKVCQNQMPRSDSRRRIVDIIFKKCCKEGQVGKFVLTQLKTVANDETHYRDLLGRSMDDDIQIRDLPREWHCNVIEGKRRRRQRLHIR